MAASFLVVCDTDHSLVNLELIFELYGGEVQQLLEDRQLGTVPVRIGVIGSGFISRLFTRELERRKSYRLGHILTRDEPVSSDCPWSDLKTHDVETLFGSSDIIVDCSNCVGWAAEVIPKALIDGKPVATLNPAFHVTVGSAYVDRGYLTEAHGSGAANQAALAEEASLMGFAPIVYGNITDALDRQPKYSAIQSIAKKHDIPVSMVMSRADGTAIQMDQALVANGMGGDIAQREMIGLAQHDLQKNAIILGKQAEHFGRPIADYLLSSSLQPGVFVIGKHDDLQAKALAYLRCGNGPYYVLKNPHVLAHLEIFKTLDRIVEGKPPLLNNSLEPRISVAAVAKKPLKPGDVVASGIGGVELRGVCVRLHETPGHLPIGLVENLTVTRKIDPGQTLTLDDVETTDSAALDAWRWVTRHENEPRSAQQHCREMTDSYALCL